MSEQKQKKSERDHWGEFVSLEWFEGVNSFLSRVLATIAEPLLIFSLVASAIDNISGGHFLSNPNVMAIWVAAQALAMEGGGGVVLDMSFEARRELDPAKMWVQRILAIALLVVGGVMFFVDLTGASLGRANSVQTQDWYAYTMSGLRAAVVMGYVAVARTKKRRYSGVEPEVVVSRHAEEIVQELRTEVQGMVQTLAERLEQVQGSAQTMVQAVQATVQVQLEQTMNQVQATVHAQKQEVHVAVQGSAQSIEQISAMVEQAMASQMRERLAAVDDLFAQVQALRTLVTEVQVQSPRALPERAGVQRVNRVQREPLNPREPQGSGREPSLVHAEQGSNNDRAKVQGFILEAMREQGRIPTLTEIMLGCKCSKNTAIRWRRKLAEIHIAEEDRS